MYRCMVFTKPLFKAAIIAAICANTEIDFILNKLNYIALFIIPVLNDFIMSIVKFLCKFKNKKQTKRKTKQKTYMYLIKKIKTKNGENVFLFIMVNIHLNNFWTDRRQLKVRIYIFIDQIQCYILFTKLFHVRSYLLAVDAVYSTMLLLC